MMSEDMVGLVARGIYDPVRHSTDRPQAPMEQLDMASQMFLRLQAKSALKRLREPTPTMIAAGMEDTDLDPVDVEQIWVRMIDCLLPRKPVANGAAHDA